MNSFKFTAQPELERCSCPRLAAAFTLVEILVSLAVLSVLLLVSAQVIGQVQDTWTASNARVSQFREARTAFDILTRNLSQATLNTYIDYNYNYLQDASTASTTNTTPRAPEKYERKSDLQFICDQANELVKGAGNSGEQYLPGHAVFFQAPLGIAQQPGLVGLDRLLCGRGYYVQFSSDAFFRPQSDFLPPGNLRFRYRLMEFSPPAEKNMIYSSGGEPWYAAAGAPMDVDENPANLSLNRPVADNIVCLIISPRREQGETSINGKTEFNSLDVARDPNVAANAQSEQGSQHLLPPMLKVVLVAIDERSAERLSNYEDNAAPPLEDELRAFNAAVGEIGSDVDIDKAVDALKLALNGLRVNYRVFASTIQIRGSKWSL